MNFSTPRATHRSTGALLIADEIQSGLGRTGKFCAYQHYGIQPDLTTLAKPLAGGIPLGALLCTEEAARAIHAGMHGTTFGGGPLGCAVALAVLDTIERDRLLEHVAAVGTYFREQLNPRKAARLHRRRARPRPHAGRRADSADLAKSVLNAMMERRILINRTSETVLRFLPPYILERQHVDQAIERSTKFSPSRQRPQQPRRPPRRKENWQQTAVLQEVETLSPAALAPGRRDLCSVADLTTERARRHP